MDSVLKHPTTNTDAKISLSVDEAENINNTFKPFASEEQIFSCLDNINVSSETKAILNEVKNMVINIGGKLIKIGLKIIETIIFLLKKYPNTVMGLIIGLAFGLLLSSVPLVGWIIGPVVTPLSAALGLAVGYMQDVGNVKLRNEIDSHIDDIFGSIKNVNVTS